MGSFLLGEEKPGFYSWQIKLLGGKEVIEKVLHLILMSVHSSKLKKVSVMSVFLRQKKDSRSCPKKNSNATGI